MSNPGIRGPERTNAKRRLIAPDLARGIMLLGIALANVTTGWIIVENPHSIYSGPIKDGSLLDEATAIFVSMFVHVRGLPMFATLVGFGIGLIAMSLWRRGYPAKAARGMLAKRYAFLGLFGVIHIVFLFFGDVLLQYGSLAVVIGLMITFSDKLLLWIAGVCQALAVIMYVGMGILTALMSDAAVAAGNGGVFIGSQASYLDQITQGSLVAVSQIPTYPILFITIAPVMLFGFVAARRGWFTDVDKHRKLLWSLVLIALAVVLLVGIPLGLAELGLMNPEATQMMGPLNEGLGWFFGPGAIAAVVLATEKMQDRLDAGAEDPGILVPFVALGQRSLTGYIAQSVLFFILVRPYMLGIGHDMGVFGQSMLALSVWAITVLMAWAMHLAGMPGPLEKLLRILAYGRNGLQSRWVPKAAGTDAPNGNGDPAST